MYIVMVVVALFVMYASLCGIFSVVVFFFFFKQKTAYEMRISDWSSDVCSSDLTRMSSSSCARICDWADVLASMISAVKLRSLVLQTRMKIGRASCRERVCQYV